MKAPPEIRIELRKGVVVIRQNRPPVTALLRGRPAAAALAAIPRLLPICGHAQTIAATRAIRAARGVVDAPDLERDRSDLLAREQGVAVVWRLAIDWPDLVGAPRQFAALRAARQATSREEIAAAIASCVPGLERVRDFDELRRWISTSPSVAARVVRETGRLEALASAEAVGVRTLPLANEALRHRVSELMRSVRFEPLDPSDDPIEVGPLAMSRDSLLSMIRTDSDLGLVTQRMLAQLLDARVIARDLAARSPPECDAHAWVDDEATGLGSAMTARGPVYHRVRLDDDGDTIEDWRCIAPTDWHFGARGPLANRRLETAEASRWVRFVVVSFDPCVRWSLGGEAAPAVEAFESDAKA